MDPSLLLAGAVFLACVAGGMAFAGRSPKASAKRVKEIASGRNPGAGRVQALAQQAAMKKRKQVNTEALKALNEREKQSRRNRLSIKGRLAQAGLPFEEPVFWIGSGVLGLIVGAIVFLTQGNALLALGAAVVSGLGLPRWVLGVMISLRQKKFTEQMADAIEVIVRGVKSGLPLNQCLQIVAREAPAPLGGEFQRLVDAQTMGTPLDQNLQRLHERMPLPEINFFNTVILIQQKTGGNLSEALGNLATVLRSRKLMREKIKALSSEAKASAMIIGALPPLVAVAVYFLQPDYISLLFTHPVGQISLLGAGVWMTIGIITMRNMINFKF